VRGVAKEVVGMTVLRSVGHCAQKLQKGVSEHVKVTVLSLEQIRE